MPFVRPFCIGFILLWLFHFITSTRGKRVVNRRSRSAATVAERVHLICVICDVIANVNVIEPLCLCARALTIFQHSNYAHNDADTD